MQTSPYNGDVRQFSDFVAANTGLFFAPDRWSDLRRGLARAADRLGFPSADACARCFVSGMATRAQIETLASDLTVGETYFFRDRRSFEILAEQIIPSLVRARRDGRRRLRFWSAACCTGEEAYSIAIVLYQTIPDLADWDVTILATDINQRYLEKAVAAVFGKWSLRGVPDSIKPFFRHAGGGQWEVLPRIKRLVRFAPLNLVDSFDSVLGEDMGAIDVIFCRNVLMYFRQDQAKKVVDCLYRAQPDGGWLITGPTELASISSGPYAASNLSGSVFHRLSQPSPPARVIFEALAPELCPLMHEKLPPLSVEPTPPPAAPAILDDAAQLRDRATHLANEGRLSEALECVDRWLAMDSLSLAAHCLRAVILEEQGTGDAAVRALRGVLYLDPECVVAHVALANLARKRGDEADATRHFARARSLLGRRRIEDDPLLRELEAAS
ncbi:MAG TPA: CheR family methyltransferase [Tepidisphaeraceae bacterium]|nr:CheR family methyltransferase [Tepidisphaeraceae bacterium]